MKCVQLFKYYWVRSLTSVSSSYPISRKERLNRGNEERYTKGKKSVKFICKVSESEWAEWSLKRFKSVDVG